MAFSFEKLKVWHRSVDFSGNIYDLTKSFPKDEQYGLSSQIKRASDSISLNIAEGSTGQSKKEYQKFLGYSIRSGIEVVGCLALAKRKFFINETEYQKFYTDAENLIISIQALRKSLTK